ncbi:hypothetical protein ACTM9O_25960 [Citrobacter freundii]|uniref:hypothetical protein n=1 Tax=Citrobacter freundii TaxID=546 RepID=UPI00374F666D
MTALNKQAHQTENERMAKSLEERNGEPVEGLRQRISELEEIATDYGMKFQKAQDALKHQSLLHKSQMEDAEKRIAELETRATNTNIQDGWVVVPVNPSMAQEYAGYKTLTDTGKMSRLMKTRIANIYRAMITAAAGIGVKGE